jgi:hypothetical protein
MNLGSTSAFLVAVSFVTPVAAVEYVQVKVQAEVTFPDVYGIEVVTPTDLFSLATGKGFNEELSSLDEIQNFDFAKVLSETPALVDNITTTLIFIRNLTETITLLDDFSRSVLPTDAVGSVDTYVSSFGKVVSDVVTMLDNMDGDIEFQLVKTTSESLAANDSQIFDVLVVKSENTTLSSSGILAMQDYSDITYFAEDYVGIARTFT